MQKKKQTQSLFFVQILILGKTIFWRESESQDNVQGYILYTRINDFLICGIQGETQLFLGVYTFSKKHCLQKITFPQKIIYFYAEYLYPFLSLPPPFSGVRGGVLPHCPPLYTQRTTLLLTMGSLSEWNLEFLNSMFDRRNQDEIIKPSEFEMNPG